MAPREDISAMRTIGEVAESLDLPQHVLRFWETRFKEINPFKRAGGRRLYRPRDIALVVAIRHLLYSEGYTIRGVQRILKEQGVDAVVADVTRRMNGEVEAPAPADSPASQPASPERIEPRLEFPEAPEEQDQPEAALAPDRDPPAGSPLDYVPPVFIARGTTPGTEAAPRQLNDEEARLLREALAEIEECQRLLKLARP